MSATNATTWETVALGLKLWALAIAVTLLLPLLLIATLVYGVFGGKMKPLPKPDLSTMEVPTGPWGSKRGGGDV